MHGENGFGGVLAPLPASSAAGVDGGAGAGVVSAGHSMVKEKHASHFLVCLCFVSVIVLLFVCLCVLCCVFFVFFCV